jgi:hypothetical protein
MQSNEIIDYAKPCMNAEKALKDAHNAVLENDLEQAMTHTMDAIIATRLMYGALRHMKKKQS